MADAKRTRLVALGFSDEVVARAVLAELGQAIARNEIEVEDYALITKDPEGKVSFTTNRSADPGPMRGAAFGGATGLVLAAISGPIGLGAVVGGAAIGAVTAALADSGFRTGDLEAVSRLMARGRSSILVAVPLASAERFQAFEAGNVVLSSPDMRYQVDIVPGRTFEQALEAYRAQQDA